MAGGTLHMQNSGILVLHRREENAVEPGWTPDELNHIAESDGPGQPARHVGRPDSSGFEHVFVGETRGGHTVIGFHNWIQLYLQEKLGHIHYKGYSVNANSPQPDENKHMLALQFSWKNGIKPKGSIFIGVSPEFEFALYTLCFLTSPNECVKVSFNVYEVEIVCHHYNQKHIGTTYPVLTKYLNV
ncbi:uridylate-specific endoribonuclease B-like [Xyrauchen texanus]|uniref:uridylate-specific endoribonuclease B-like n=1 Tax=Xyrauchen texanus TaxID=154827 RepID=UPI0022421BCC|nr:uridylate-specific endoribonuclease B-like [Xyrauchen texanus]